MFLLADAFLKLDLMQSLVNLQDNYYSSATSVKIKNKNTSSNIPRKFKII